MAKSLFSLKQPKEMYFLALTEICQRFAFWGVANLLVIYLVQQLKFTDTSADHLFGRFTGFAFVLPILGGYIADRLNYRLPIISGILATSIGCFLLASGSILGVYLALFFIAIGTSIFTPSIYALLGTLYHNKHDLRDSGFSIYYSIVNIGIFLGMVTLGTIGEKYNWEVAFLIAGLIQLLALFPFSKALKTINLNEIKSQSSGASKKIQPPLNKHEISRIWVICILCLFSILFWAAYNQGGSSMNLFALDYTNRNIMGFEMPASWLLASESFYLIVLAIPLAKLYLYLAKRKMDPTPPMKSALSLFAMGICFLIMMIGAGQLSSGSTDSMTGMISPAYLFTAYAFMALGEMLIAPIGLSLITHLSPRRFTALLVGVWYTCIGVAFYLGGMIAPYLSKLKSMSSFFGIFVLISFVFGGILLLLVKKLNAMRHLKTK